VTARTEPHPPKGGVDPCGMGCSVLRTQAAGEGRHVMPKEGSA
jgi:hypothetical protein